MFHFVVKDIVNKILRIILMDHIYAKSQALKLTDNIIKILLLPLLLINISLGENIGNVYISANHKCDFTYERKFDLELDTWGADIIINIPSFNVYNIHSIHFLDNNYYTDSFNIKNKTTITVGNLDYKYFKEFPLELKIDYGYNYKVNQVIYDKKSFIEADESIKRCKKLYELKKTKQEEPSNRLRNFFGLDYKYK